MKRGFVLLFFFLLACFVQAQNISVVKFQKLPENDLDARVNSPVLDQNGKKCALIKVVTTEKGFTFDAGQLGVRTVVVKDSLAEVWVYVPEGVNKLKITHPQLGQIKSDDGYYWFPEGGVDAATCYRMEITTARVITTIEEPEKRSGYLILTSEPSGASIYITVNGEEIYYGQTPMEGELLPYGTYRYRLAKSMYHQASGKIGVENGRVEKHIALQPAFGYLDIKTQPSDAQIIVEGQNTEYTSPCKLQLSSGTYKVRLTKKLYGTSEYEISIRDNQTTPLNATLDPKFAHLVVNTLTGASVYADGKFIGKGPKCGVDLLAGLHDIEAQLTSHKTVKKQIEITAKKDQEISLSPTPILGTLNIKPGSTNDATIFIDNKNYGKAPQVIDNILVGKHTVRLEKAGYESIVKEVWLKEGEMFSFEEKMGNKHIPLTVNPSESVQFSADGGWKMLKVSPQSGWTLGEQTKNSHSWLTIKRIDGSIGINALKNNTQNSRYAQFVISTPTEKRTISIVQQADIKAVTPLTISSSRVLFPAKGGKKRLNVLSQEGWYLGEVETPSSARSWLTVKSGDGYVQVKAKRNKSHMSRFGFFLIGTQKERQQIDIYQDGVYPRKYELEDVFYMDYSLLAGFYPLGYGGGFSMGGYTINGVNIEVWGSCFAMRENWGTHCGLKVGYGLQIGSRVCFTPQAGLGWRWIDGHAFTIDAALRFSIGRGVLRFLLIPECGFILASTDNYPRWSKAWWFNAGLRIGWSLTF